MKDHALLGQVIYRPQFSPLYPTPHQKGEGSLTGDCHWYLIVSYTPSVKAVEPISSTGAENSSNRSDNIPRSETTGEEDSTTTAATTATALPNLIVKRRARFRAIQMAELDIGASISKTIGDIDINDQDFNYMILTEGQTRAGMEAAALHCKIENKQNKSKDNAAKEEELAHALGVGNCKSAEIVANQLHGHGRSALHPYRNGHGSRVMLTPQPDKDSSDVCQFEVLYGVIAGYTTITTTNDLTENNEVFQHKLLVLLEENGGKNNITNRKDEEAGKSGGQNSNSHAFWATVDPRGTFLTNIVQNNSSPKKDNYSTFTAPKLQLSSRYNFEMHDFYQGSPAFNACESIILYLKKHSKSGPFMSPVDPIALGIPEYPTIIKFPMDISTLAQNLEEGKYSRIHPTTRRFDTNTEEEEEDWTYTPVYRMAYGPFYYDLMLIFDNCIRFNNETSWIGNEAVILKKTVVKKVEQVVSRADQGQSNAKASGGGVCHLSSRTVTSKSIYAEQDSDTDMYEYESDYEDDDGVGHSKRKYRGRGSNKPSRTRKGRSKENTVSSQAIEQTFTLPETAYDFVSGGAFPHLKILTDIGKFSVSQNWSCSHIQENPNTCTGGGSSSEGQETGEDKEDSTVEDEFSLLLKVQQEHNSGSCVRRSTRSRHAPTNYANEEGFVNPVTTTLYAPQTSITLPGVEYYLLNSDVFQPKRRKALGEQEEGKNNITNDDNEENSIPITSRSRLGVEGVQEVIHERFYAKLYHDHSPNASILDSAIGKYENGSFPPYLGHIVPTSVSPSTSVVWEIREQYLIPALRWVLRGLVKSGHLEEVDGSLSEGIFDDAPSRTTFGAGTIVPNHEYYYNEMFPPLDVLDEKEILRKRRQDAAAGNSDSSSEEEVELSAYEQMRAERVARNAERLKVLGLA